MTQDNSDTFWSGFFVGFVFAVLCLLFVSAFVSERVFPEKVAIEKGAAVYRIKPGTVNQIEFVWKCDLEKEDK